MTLVRWSPKASQVAHVHDSFDAVLNGFLSGPWFTPGSVSAANADWTPATDVVEEPNRFVLSIDLPGMRREDLKISVESDSLIITGERKRETEANEKGYSRFERVTGTFTRVFSLPNTIDGRKIDANYKDGVLSVLLPKSEEARPKSIEVRVN